MPKITVLPNPKYCPEGAEFEMATGENLIRGLLSHGVKIEHACEMSCACSTCHVIIRKGFDSLEEPSDKEYDCLDKAWGVGAAVPSFLPGEGGGRGSHDRSSEVHP